MIGLTLLAVSLTAPLGLVGVVPMLLLFQVPFGFNGILGLIGRSGILTRNTLTLIDQIHINDQAGLGPMRRRWRRQCSGRCRFRPGDARTYPAASIPAV